MPGMPSKQATAGNFFPHSTGNYENDLRRLILDARAQELEMAQMRARSGLFASLPDSFNPFEEPVGPVIEELPPRRTADPFGDDPFAEPAYEELPPRRPAALGPEIFRRRRPELD